MFRKTISFFSSFSLITSTRPFIKSLEYQGVFSPCGIDFDLDTYI